MTHNLAYSEGLLQQLTEAHGTSGFESEVTRIIEDELSAIGKLSYDKLGGITCELGPEDAPKILICSHQDEVGFRIQSITPDGFLQFMPVGGWWGHTLLAQKVTLKNRFEKKFSGIICSQPVHFLPASQKNAVIPIESMYIDIGALSKKQVEEEFQLRVGDPIVPATSFEKLPNHRYTAKAFDNRVGVACMIEVGRQLKEIEHQLTHRIVLGATVQEEVGLRGAKVMANRIDPDFAIILEGPPADDTPGFNPALSQGRMGMGCQIRLQDSSAILDPTLSNQIIDTAEAHNIPLQITMRRSGGTDAGAIHQSGNGVPCAALGVPSRYIHTHHSMIDIKDYFAMIELTTQAVLSFS